MMTSPQTQTKPKALVIFQDDKLDHSKPLELKGMHYPSRNWTPLLCLVNKNCSPYEIYEVQEVFGPSCAAFVDDGVVKDMRKLVITRFNRDLFYLRLIEQLFKGRYRVLDDVLVSLHEEEYLCCDEKAGGVRVLGEHFKDLVQFIREDRALFTEAVKLFCDCLDDEDAFRFSVSKTVDALLERMEPLLTKRTGVELLSAYASDAVLCAILTKLGPVPRLMLEMPVYATATDAGNGEPPEKSGNKRTPLKTQKFEKHASVGTTMTTRAKSKGKMKGQLSIDMFCK